MARIPKPWWRDESQCYYVTIRGVQHRLDPKKSTAHAMFMTLLNEPAGGLERESAVVLIDQFLDWCQKNRPDSYSWYFQFLNPFCKVVDGLRVDEVGPDHVQVFIDRPSWGPAAKRAAITAIRRAFNWGIKLGKIKKNPAKAVDKPEAPFREQIITRELHDLIITKVGKAFAELLELAWETGARPFELYRLETRHVELNNCRAVFPKSEAKGKKRQRVIYFSDAAMQIVKRNVRGTGPVIRNTDGDAWTIHSINSAFNRLSRKMQPRYCLYNWRHSFAHRKLSEGLDSMVVATLMGHSSTQMLERVYGHLHRNQDFLLAQVNRTPPKLAKRTAG